MNMEGSPDTRQEPNVRFRSRDPADGEKLPPAISEDVRVLKSPCCQWSECQIPQFEDTVGREASRIIQQDDRLNYLHAPFPVHDPVPPAYDEASRASAQYDVVYRVFRESQ